MLPNSTTALRHVDEVERFAASRIGRLQAEYLSSAAGTQPSSWAAAMMSGLRRLPPATLTSDPRVWAVTLQDMPEILAGRSDKPSRGERAIHAGLVLYAVHQQSRTDPMHVPDVAFGTAVQRTARTRSASGDLDPATLRRFEQVIVSTTWERRAYHLREIMSLLRAHRSPLDHIRLTGDLYRLQWPESVAGVRLRWGRDLYRPVRRNGQDASTIEDGVQQ